jgi:hypothetical protein
VGLSAQRQFGAGVAVVEGVVTVVLGLGVAEVSDAGGAAVGEANLAGAGVGGAAGLYADVGFSARVGAAFALTVNFAAGAAC